MTPHRFLTLRFILLVGCCLPMTFCHAQELKQIDWNIRMLTIDANEGIDLADFNRDGLLDVVAGRNWYAAPDFVARPLRTIEDWNGYVQSNGDHAIDVDRDGWTDVVAGSFLPTQVYWFQNPGAEGLTRGQLWQKHLLVDTENTNNEAQLLVNVVGDATPEWIVNSWSKNSALYAWQFALPDKDASTTDSRRTLSRIVISNQGNGHGLGVGDLNADGHTDILTGRGWFENPGPRTENPQTHAWKYRADWDMHASVPILVDDIDKNGLPDIIIGNAHDFGLYWWEQQNPSADGRTNWQRHLIDDQFSQPHCLHLADLDGDDLSEVISGKRVRAHNGNDPGGDMPPCLYFYRWNSKSRSFDRNVIDEGHVGTGLQIRSGDLDQDGRTDLAVAGKSGTFLLFNRQPVSAADD